MCEGAPTHARNCASVDYVEAILGMLLMLGWIRSQRTYSVLLLDVKFHLNAPGLSSRHPKLLKYQ